jgi:hypothetical protein
MWDTAIEISTHLTHDRPCPRCDHAEHRFLPCDRCACAGVVGAAYAGGREPAPVR